MTAVCPVVGNRVQNTHGTTGVGDGLGVENNVRADCLALLVNAFLLLLDVGLILGGDGEEKNQCVCWLWDESQELFVETCKIDGTRFRRAKA